MASSASNVSMWGVQEIVTRMERCPACPGDKNVVPFSGPEDADILFIGEGPGFEEDRKREPFCGKTGQEVNGHYMPLGGCSRPRVRVGNAISCFPPGPKGKLDPNREKDLALLESCANFHLYPEIERMQPKLIIPMGAFACRAIEPGINLELQHGIPLVTSWGDTFPMYHPASGIHEPKRMLMLRNDWIRLGKYRRGKLHIPTDEYEGQEDYRCLKEPWEVDEKLNGMWGLPLAGDTETTRDHEPFCLTFSADIGTGYLIRRENQPCLDAFQRHVDRWKGPILFHNWLFDCEVVRAMGLRFPHRRIVDTMVRVFHLGNLPQGLKALAYRELRMTMQDFDDLVSPHSEALVLDYYRQAYAEEWESPPTQQVREKDGSWKEYKPQNFSTKLKRFFTDYAKAKRNGTEKDVFKMWHVNWEKLHTVIEDRLGRWPGKCISHVPFQQVIKYACRDTDSLLRLWPILKRMERNVRRTSQENWGDLAA